MKRHLTFIDFLCLHCNGYDDPAGHEWAIGFVRRLLTQIHGGDCTKQAYTCDLCYLEQCLADYREYQFDFDKFLKENDLTETP